MMVACRVSAVLFAALVLLVAAGVRGVDETECTSAYNYLVGCLTFVSGPDVIPNPVCCGGVTHLSIDDPHCLCFIIRELDSNPNVNFTKACALPHQCSASVDPAECPNLPPGYSLPPSLPPHPPLPGDDSSGASPRIFTPFHMVALTVFFTALLGSIIS